MLGLGATVWRLQQTMELVDDSSTTNANFKAMMDRALLWSKVGLGAGSLAFLGYLFSFYMHHRLKEQVKAEREEARRLALLEGEGEGEGEDEDV